MHSLCAERRDETQRIIEIVDEIRKILNSDVAPPGMNSINMTKESGPLDDSYSDVSNSARQSLIQNENKKLIAKSRKKGAKALKNTDDIKDMKESFNVNEEDGIKVALDSQQDKLDIVKNKKAEIIKLSTPQSRNESLKQIPGSANASSISKMDKASMMSQLNEAKELEKRIKDDERTRAKEELIRGGEDASKTIVFPKYKMDERLKVYKEYDPPSDKLYIGLGWDETRDQNRKHYRKYYEDELENDTDLFETKSPFNTYEMKKGQARGASTGMFSAKAKDASG